MALVGREGLVGTAVILGGDSALGRYLVHLPGSALALEISRFRSALRASPKLRAACETSAQALFVQVLHTAACNRLHSLEQRCARWLLGCADRMEEDAFEVTREALAELLGAPRSAVTAIARRLQEAGAISDRRGAIAVINRPGLEAVACDCYRIVRNRNRRLFGQAPGLNSPCSDRTPTDAHRSGLMAALNRVATIGFLLIALSTVVATGTTRVQESRETPVPHLIGSHRDWNVYEIGDAEETICYVASKPKKQEGNYTRRGNPVVVVTRRPGAQVLYEVSVQPGYVYLDGSNVEVQIERRRFLLFTRGEHAWTRKEEDDRNLISAMRRGVKMTVSGTSSKNTYSLDTYSLLGFTAAYDAMVHACGNAGTS